MTEEALVVQPEYPDVQRQYADFLRGDYMKWAEQYQPTEAFIQSLGMDEQTRQWLEQSLNTLADEYASKSTGYTRAAQLKRRNRYNTTELPENKHRARLIELAGKNQMNQFAGNIRSGALAQSAQYALADKQLGAVSLGNLASLQNNRINTNAGIAAANRNRIRSGLASAVGQYTTAAMMGNPVTGGVMAGLTILGSI